MANSLHRIRRQSWLIKAGSKEQAFNLRKQVREEWETAILPVIEKAFDELSPNGEVIRFQSINLSLKAELFHEQKEDLQETIYHQIIEQFQNNISGHKLLNGKGNMPDSRSGEQFEFDNLLHYLLKGTLPWEITNLASGDIQAGFQSTMRNQAGEILSYISSHSLTSDFFFRLLQLVPDGKASYLEPIAEGIRADWGQDLMWIVRELTSKELAYPNLYERLTLASEMLVMSLDNKDKSSAPDFTFLLRNRHFINDGSEMKEYISALPLTSMFFPGLQDISDPDLLKSGYTVVDVESVITPEGKNNIISGNPDSVDLEKIAALPVSGIDYSQGAMQQNVGLILIHPFIKPLFENTGIISEGSREITLNSLPRAAALLHFIATGNEDVHEFELGFIKVLLGLEPAEPLLISMGLLGDSDRREVDSLLQSVISHWAVLKNTSIEGLRTSFLQRNGILAFNDEQWALSVESKPFDMLLQLLPWSFGIMKFPWMKKPIMTEWQAL